MSAATDAAPAAAAVPDAAKTGASGSSFYTAMRILPAAQRDAMYAIYGFCRAVDDVVDDGDSPRPQRRAALDGWRDAIDRLYRGEATPLTAGLAESVKRFHLERDDFQAVIDGMAMDAEEQDIRAPDWATLDLYCDRVASAVGRLSVNIFGMARGPGVELAHHLGRALQLTNIVRDVDEDAAIGRLYLPREALQGAGITATNPAAVVADGRLGAACAPVIARARDHYIRAEAIMAGQPRAAVKAPRIMGAAYRMILDRTEARGFAPPRTRVRLPKARLLLTVLRFGVF